MQLKRPDNGEPLDESRLFKRDSLLSVYVPPKPPPHPDDWKRDFPPGYPPEVHYNSVRANYWQVIESGEMLYMGYMKKFGADDLEWLRSLEGAIEEIWRNDR